MGIPIAINLKGAFSKTMAEHSNEIDVLSWDGKENTNLSRLLENLYLKKDGSKSTSLFLLGLWCYRWRSSSNF